MEVPRFIGEIRWEHIPAQARRMAERCVLDTVGCALAGTEAEGFPGLVEHLRGCGRDEASPVWGMGVTAGVPWSIFLNAYSASFFDLDDGHRLAQGHPGAAIIPAALSVAGSIGSSGREFLEAVVCGYEIAVRSALIMRSLGGPRKGSGAWGAAGVAGAIARLLHLDGPQILHALGAAEFHAPQTPQDRSSGNPSMIKEAIPWGAYTGSMAAFLAARGFRAMPPLLSESPLAGDLGDDYQIEKVYFKRHAACRFIHPVLDGLARLLNDTRLTWRRIERIDIQTFDKGVLLNRWSPDNAVGAMYSYPFAVASFLRHGRLGPKEISGAALRDPEVLGLAQRVTIREDKEMTSLFPERCLARMVVFFDDGSRHESGLMTAKGDPDDPLTDGELVDKFKILVSPRFGHLNEEIPRLVCRLANDDKALAEMMRSLSGKGENALRE